VNLGVDLIGRFVAASDGFARRLRLVTPDQWGDPTPCTEWDVRALVNHVTQSNLNYVRILDGASAGEFLRWRDVDALGDDPVGAFAKTARDCAAAYAAPDAMERTVDHPSGTLSGRQALSVRTTDTLIHTWDLARGLGEDDTLDAALLEWVDTNIGEIYADMAETPVAQQTTHRFYAAPTGDLAPGSSTQDSLLHLFGRRITWPA
jgi:uncharacterized protein (TIGR03086 family)